MLAIVDHLDVGDGAAYSGDNSNHMQLLWDVMNGRELFDDVEVRKVNWLDQSQ